VTERVFQGSFLTRGQAVHRSGIPAHVLTHRPDLLRLGGRWLQEVYFEFQFDAHGINHDLSRIVRTLKADYDDIEIADWLARANPSLNNHTPLDSLSRGVSVERVLHAATVSGPIRDAMAKKPAATPSPTLDRPTETSPVGTGARGPRFHRPTARPLGT